MQRTRWIIAAALLGGALTGCGREDAAKPAIRVQAPMSGPDAKQKLDQAAAVIDDATLTARVKAALIATPRIKGLTIDVDTSNNIVTLSGSVDSAAMRADAERVATSIEGVKEVRNRLTVRQPS